MNLIEYNSFASKREEKIRKNIILLAVVRQRTFCTSITRISDIFLLVISVGRFTLSKKRKEIIFRSAYS